MDGGAVDPTDPRLGRSLAQAERDADGCADLPVPELLAPWPANQCFRAGGSKNPVYLAQITALRLMGPIERRAFAMAFSGGGCGWGIPGFYYDTWPTHDEHSYFAIDFLRYRRFHPFHNASGGTPVLAARSGTVGEVKAGGPTGGRQLNRTHIFHPDPANPEDQERYMSRYLHLDGPFVDNVSEGMAIYAGNRLGRMDSTGKPPNFMKHLHFSIHDNQVPYPNVFYGASLRPTPMSGVTLNDDESGKCVCSDNVEHKGEGSMNEPLGYPVQNWAISPVAPSVTRPMPTSISEQRFILVLSGIAEVEFKGSSEDNWRFTTVRIMPDIVAPIQRACDDHQIARPEGEPGQTYLVNFHVEQWVQYAGLSSIYNENESNDSGFAVNTWRPHPFFNARDFFTNQDWNRAFAGVQVDIGARDTDAYLKRIGYHLTLLGRIVFSPILIT